MDKGKILVTGGTGYIGSHTAVELIKSGYSVSIIDDLSNSSIDALDGISEITGTRPDFTKLDMLDQAGMATFFEKQSDIVGVIHFAAYKAVGESVSKPAMYYKNNILSLLNLMECMKTHSIAPLVFSSSCTVYGQPDTLPVTESAPFQEASSPYGNTKQICEEILKDELRSASAIKAISLRYFNPVGAHDSGLIGELPQGVPNNLIPYLTQTVSGAREYLRVFGNDYDTKDGTCIRDYIHVSDLAEAHVTAVKRILNASQKSDYEIFNLGTGHGYSVLDVIHAFERATHKKVNYKITDRRPGDIEQIYADTQYANEELGWSTTRSIDEMMRTAWAWEERLAGKASPKA